MLQSAPEAGLAHKRKTLWRLEQRLPAQAQGQWGQRSRLSGDLLLTLRRPLHPGKQRLLAPRPGCSTSWVLRPQFPVHRKEYIAEFACVHSRARSSCETHGELPSSFVPRSRYGNRTSRINWFSKMLTSVIGDWVWQVECYQKLIISLNVHLNSSSSHLKLFWLDSKRTLTKTYQRQP
jgi:hypothetical protein